MVFQRKVLPVFLEGEIGGSSSWLLLRNGLSRMTFLGEVGFNGSGNIGVSWVEVFLRGETGVSSSWLLLRNGLSLITFLGETGFDGSDDFGVVSLAVFLSGETGGDLGVSSLGAFFAGGSFLSWLSALQNGLSLIGFLGEPGFVGD